MRKLPMRSRWLSITQKPYSSRILSFSSLIFYKYTELVFYPLFILGHFIRPITQNAAHLV